MQDMWQRECSSFASPGGPICYCDGGLLSSNVTHVEKLLLAVLPPGQRSIPRAQPTLGCVVKKSYMIQEGVASGIRERWPNHLREHWPILDKIGNWWVRTRSLSILKKPFHQNPLDSTKSSRLAGVYQAQYFIFERSCLSHSLSL